MQIALVGFVLLLLSAGVVAQQAATDKLSKSDEGLLYDQAIHILGGNANVISKWQEDIRYAIIGGRSEESAAMARNTLNEVAVLTGLPLTQIDHKLLLAGDYLAAIEQSPPFQLAACDHDDAQLCANFIVLFADTKTMQTLASAIPLRPVYQRSISSDNTINCFFAPFVTRSLQIAQAFVYVRDDLSQGMLRTCLQEEIYQSFGMFNDYSGSRFFSFNNIVKPKSITQYDRSLLSTIYDPSIMPGDPVWKVMDKLMNNLGIDPFSE